MEDHGQGEALLKVAPQLPADGKRLPRQDEGTAAGGAGRRDIWSGLGVSASGHPSTERPGLLRGGGVQPRPWLPAGAPAEGLPPAPLTEALPSQQRQRARRRARWSPSSGSSSNSSWEDSEPEEAPEDVPEGAPAGGPEPPPAQYAVPDMDLWVPARQSTEELRGAVAGGCPRPPEGPDTAQATAPAPTGQLASRSRSADPRTVGCLCPATAHRWSSEGLLGKVGSGCSTPLPGGHRGCAQWRQRPGCGAEASPLHVTAPAPGP